MASCDTGTVAEPGGSAEEPSALRCRKCRRQVADSACLLSASKEVMGACSVWHVDVDTLPDWISSAINQVHWTVGKLNCQNCGARLGSFNFINCPRCPCGRDTAVHLSKSRVDQAVKHSVHFSRPGRARRHADKLKCQTGILGNQKELEEPETARDLESIPYLNQDLQLATQMLAMQAQMTSLDAEDAFISPFTRPSDFSYVSPVVQEIPETHALINPSQEPQSFRSAETDSEGPVAQERQIPVEPSVHQESSGDHRSAHLTQPETPSLDTEELEPEDLEQEQEEQVHHNTSSSAQKLTKRERNRLKSLKRKQRKRERWIQNQVEEKELGGKWNLTSSDDEDKDGYTCAVCLDVYYNPYMCQPCSHVFCEPCLRTVAKNRPRNTPCPLCRTLISHVLFQQELHQTTRTCFPKEYLLRKETFQSTNYSKWPLPSCPKRFHIFWGFQRRAASQFPHRAFRLDGLDLGDMRRGWLFDSDIVIISIYSFHWLLAFIIFCGLCYFFLL
ncbi:E3 ubiquitin-protein ligase RNF180 isoform X3 [Astyanax mexicanus]|uniref:E3 ubiquitin-protein ligase RNF180 n=1 Tax=Astyanax mexicanus TaxID=7994 RepID=A0A8T2L696_ASTMX|nr:E3 ubiquitin-protein ligase RNF180 isoform X3 [Astyanax mexicanus]KAG9265545.1 E3 ubiquitin-protein ligase RNF180 isoform X3 [Astyanax mexicanus]